MILVVEQLNKQPRVGLSRVSSADSVAIRRRPSVGVIFCVLETDYRTRTLCRIESKFMSENFSRIFLTMHRQLRQPP